MHYKKVLKILASIFSVFLVLLYMSPVVLKLKDVALSIVVAIGVAMMLVDQWESLKSREE